MKIGFLGAGHLGGAIIKGLLASKKYQQEDFHIVVGSDSSMAAYQKENFKVSKDWATLADCEVVLLALRPDDISKNKEQLSAIFSKQQIIISVAAGVNLQQLQAIFPNASVSRAMPNTSCQFNQSMTMIAQEGKPEANQTAQEIFNLLGKTIVLPEEKIHVFIAICGSASAYLYYWLQPLMQMALDSKISLADSKSIITELLVGVAANIQHSSDSLAELQKQVSVPGGTTIEAISVFDQHNLKQVVSEAIAAVAKRSQELA
ncbi:pyrroline-5-carboxylate reductase family protein [Spiroplasma platyhelix]|uniref:Pyrroline-5-carboxylate reductase n=1 Tax=Spiroplasma platyhelix PALS-1 TaxID=1276218 RepID=A0A846U2P0_9MOLU|nr:pyrroline-5-carboxylate reductase [Spiroplasma platyhelix]MBE4704418.1 Pyrroline-5-carboxylate reductase [Spiroplasma platyhelix PALS-1]NKE38789.1 pyrroline-5-carboxylate reductase [Spiroplasma platyhelix PALS-1]UJB29000.1 pyrroline-5-carboxylate reductase [Spiroplasma platyhelix PALS-1]